MLRWLAERNISGLKASPSITFSPVFLTIFFILQVSQLRRRKLNVKTKLFMSRGERESPILGFASISVLATNLKSHSEVVTAPGMWVCMRIRVGPGETGKRFRGSWGLQTWAQGSSCRWGASQCSHHMQLGGHPGLLCKVQGIPQAIWDLPRRNHSSLMCVWLAW